MSRRPCKPLALVALAAFALAPQAAAAATYAPLDCDKAATAAETTICKSYTLGQDEARLATLFGVLTSLVAMGQRGDLVDTQRRFIAIRDACGADTRCLAKAYAVRIEELSQALDELAKRGPF